jgi:hypothetical protein
MLMIELVNTIFEDISNSHIEYLRYYMPMESKGKRGRYYFIDKIAFLDPQKGYCNPYYFRNGYELVVSTTYCEGNSIEVLLRFDGKLIYSKLRKI